MIGFDDNSRFAGDLRQFILHAVHAHGIWFAGAVGMHDKAGQGKFIDQTRQVVDPVFEAGVDVDVQIAFGDSLIGVGVFFDGVVAVLAPAVGIGGDDQRAFLLLEKLSPTAAF